jgi:hypothetical protein
MRTRHDLLDGSTFARQLFFCACGHFSISCSWQEAAGERGRFEQHVALWEAAEAELDEVDPTSTI